MTDTIVFHQLLAGFIGFISGELTKDKTKLYQPIHEVSRSVYQDLGILIDENQRTITYSFKVHILEGFTKIIGIHIDENSSGIKWNNLTHLTSIKVFH